VYTLGESPALVEEVDQFVQVLTEEGKARGDVQVSYAPPDERLVFLDCEVRRPDGSFARLDPEQMQAASAPSAPPGHPARGQHAFSLPGITPGAILRVHYRREWRRFPLPHVFLDVPLAADVPTLDARVDVRTGLATPLHHAMREAPAMAPEVRETPFARIHSWRLGRVQPVAAEALAPPGRGPRLLVSTFPDWGSFAEWYRRLILLADQVTPEIEAAAAEVVRGKAGEREKVKALYEFVTRLRYVAVPLGVNSHRPHAAANVLRNRYGDCKDKANLFNTLLKTQGIAAHLVLVPRFDEVQEAVPGLGFNHAISRVRVDGEWLWADTTDEFARFGLLPPGDPGRRVLVIDGREARLTTLPRPRPAEHGLRLRARVPHPAHAASTLEVHARGFSDYALRQVARLSAGQGTTSPLLAGELRPWAGSFALHAQRHTAVAALDEDFTWRGEGTWSGLSSDAADGRTALRAPFWLPEEWAAALHARRTPLFLNQGYPLELEERLHLELPRGARVLALPPPAAAAEPPLAWRVEWSAPPEGGLLAELRAELAEGELGGAQTRAFQEQLRALADALAQAAIYAAGGSTR
jgi:transglutaminase-like putative cysteine protease